MTRSGPGRDVVQATVAALRRMDGVSYGDARVADLQAETITLRGGEVERLSRDHSRGIGVRVLVDGAWGYGARPEVSEEAALAAARDAVAVARAGATVGNDKVRLAEEEPRTGTWSTPVEVEPFAVPLERKLGDLEAAVAVLRAPIQGAELMSVEARMTWRREHKLFASTEGADTEQWITLGGAGIKIVVSGGGEIAVRNWPMDYDGGIRGAGYETIAALDLPRHAARIREEALELLSADACPSGPRTLILDTPQLALQIHESCGHPTESDRALGEEISLAGASFLTPDKLGRFRYGSERVDLTADSTRKHGLGTFGWDDEGVSARRTPLISRGMFVGYLSSRETAERIGLGRSAGCMRAESYARPPIIRMINVSLEPDDKGPASLAELVADTDDGILMTTNRSWSIDDLRLNFQFGCEAAWEVKHGKIVRILKKPIYTGSTPRFWGGCDAICAPDAFRMWGFLSCGKGDPMQLMAVGHGCAPARFRDVEVGELVVSLDALELAVLAAKKEGVDDVEVSHVGRTLGMSRFANSRITQAGNVVERTTRIRVAFGGRLGAATTSALDEASLGLAVAQAVEAARHSPAQRDFAGFAKPGAEHAADSSVPATDSFGPRQRAEVLGGIFARASRDKLLCAGGFTTSARETAVATGAGVRVAHRGSEASLSLIALDGDASGYASFFGGDITRLDAAALAETAVDKAARSRDPLDLPPAAYDVVLGPPAVAELCEWLALASFSARAMLDGMSLLTGHQPGDALCDPRVTIADEPGFVHPSAIPSPFDSEGVSRRKVVMIDAGRAGTVVSDLSTAAKLGTTSTGHAPSVGNDLSDGPIAAQLVFHPGADTVDELVGRVERGLYITRFHYVNGLLDTRKATMTGMTRDGTFLIEHGRAGRAVKNLRFTESILAALGRVGGIGRELSAIPTSWAGHGAYLCPALLLRGFTFTGRSR